MCVVIFRYIVGVKCDPVNGNLTGWNDEKVEK